MKPLHDFTSTFPSITTLVITFMCYAEAKRTKQKLKSVVYCYMALILQIEVLLKVCGGLLYMVTILIETTMKD